MTEKGSERDQRGTASGTVQIVISVIGVVGLIVAAVIGNFQNLFRPQKQGAGTRDAAGTPDAAREANPPPIPGPPDVARPEVASTDCVCSKGLWVQIASGHSEGHTFSLTQAAITKKRQKFKRSCFLEIQTKNGPAFGAILPEVALKAELQSVLLEAEAIGDPLADARYRELEPIRQHFCVTELGEIRDLRDWR